MANLLEGLSLKVNLLLIQRWCFLLCTLHLLGVLVFQLLLCFNLFLKILAFCLYFLSLLHLKFERLFGLLNISSKGFLLEFNHYCLKNCLFFAQLFPKAFSDNLFLEVYLLMHLFNSCYHFSVVLKYLLRFYFFNFLVHALEMVVVKYYFVA